MVGPLTWLRTINWIKLDQYKHSSASNIPTLLIKNNKNIDFYTVKAVWEYWQIRKHTNMNTVLFSFMDGSSISRQFLSDKLQLSLTWAKLRQSQVQKSQFPHRFSYYSSNLGITEDKFNPCGRWNSNAFKKYVRIPVLKL